MPTHPFPEFTERIGGVKGGPTQTPLKRWENATDIQTANACR